jgi:hypothetical protein
VTLGGSAWAAVDKPLAITPQEGPEVTQRDSKARRPTKTMHDAQCRRGRLFQRHGNCEEAVRLQRPIYNGFTKGLSTADPREARALLDELA